MFHWLELYHVPMLNKSLGCEMKISWSWAGILFLEGRDCSLRLDYIKSGFCHSGIRVAGWQQMSLPQLVCLLISGWSCWNFSFFACLFVCMFIPINYFCFVSLKRVSTVLVNLLWKIILFSISCVCVCVCVRERQCVFVRAYFSLSIPPKGLTFNLLYLVVTLPGWSHHWSWSLLLLIGWFPNPIVHLWSLFWASPSCIWLLNGSLYLAILPESQMSLKLYKFPSKLT